VSNFTLDYYYEPSILAIFDTIILGPTLWPIIQRLAATTGPAPKSPGRKTRITPQEKDTARRLVIALGYGHSRDSILKARSYLKLLSDIREAGVTLLLLYRTKEFRTHFL
jgi:hypothetical protein